MLNTEVVGPSGLKQYVFIMLGMLAYSGLLSVIAIILGGAGHGSCVPIKLFFSPTWLFLRNSDLSRGPSDMRYLLTAVIVQWLIGGLLGMIQNDHRRRFFVSSFLALHYGAFVVHLFVSPDNEWWKMFHDPLFGLVTVFSFFVYFVGQKWLWSRLVCRVYH